MKISNKKFAMFILYFISFLFLSEVVYSLSNVYENISIDLLSLLCTIVYAVVLILLMKDKLLKDLRDFKSNFVKYLEIIFKWWAIGLGVMILSNLIINYVIFSGSIAGNEEVVRASLSSAFLITAISAVIFAPITEEIIFRYSLKFGFKNIWCYSIVSGLIFGLIHALTLISTPLELLYIIPYGALGFAFGYMYFKTDNIFTSMMAHFLHNFIMIMLLVMFM